MEYFLWSGTTTLYQWPDIKVFETVITLLLETPMLVFGPVMKIRF